MPVISANEAVSPAEPTPGESEILTPTLSAEPGLLHRGKKFSFLCYHHTKDKKKQTALCVGIAEGGARTRDLEVWNI
jgi:hypothetical protein